VHRMKELSEEELILNEESLSRERSLLS